jgi:small nuclear ribonucleoprotein (snRNP)-like protein
MTATSTSSTTEVVAPLTAAATAAAEAAAARAREGPLFLLRDLSARRQRARVRVRRAVGLRGYCDGYIVAFDKHFDLLMLDVSEVCTVPRYEFAVRRVADENNNAPLSSSSKSSLSSSSSSLSSSSSSSSSLSAPSATWYPTALAAQASGATATTPASSVRTRRRKVFVCVRRHYRQLFVRGDNVVLVHAAPS